MINDSRIADYLCSLEPEMPEYLSALEMNALKEEVPIIRKDSQALLRFLLRDRKPKRILEVGTAVGFSCMLMAEYMPKDAVIVTVEKVPMRIVPAKKNLKSSPNAERIALLIGDANEVLKELSGEKQFAPQPEAEERDYGLQDGEKTVEGDCSAKEERGANSRGEEEQVTRLYLPAGETSEWNGLSFTEPYDMIFMDAAKGQYMNFLPHILQLLAPNGLFVTDNVLQEGSIADSKFAITRRDRTIHMRMREYLYELTHREDLNTVILAEGDGMSLTTKVNTDK